MFDGVSPLKEKYFAKRFIVENKNKEEVFISENKGSFLELISTDWRPVFELVFNKLRNKSINIKTAMMDNKIVVGVGNIYINEALFHSRINPQIKAKEISLERLKILIKNIILYSY